MLSQLIVLFGFFALVLVTVYWINKAVLLFDRLVGDGQSALVFLEFSILTLPTVISLMMPVAGFAAAVYATNRMIGNSELVVMQATGFGPWRLTKPVLYYGVLIAILMSILMHVLVPASRSQLRLRETEISRNLVAKLLVEGTFINPAKGVTFFIRRITPDSELLDVYLSDRRDPQRAMTYTASKAFLINKDDSTRLVMVDGLSQGYFPEQDRLFTTHFKDFVYDLSGFLTPAKKIVPSVRELSTFSIITTSDTQMRANGISQDAIIREVNFRLSQSLFALAGCIIGFCSLLLGGFSRFGVWPQIGVAILVVVLLKVVEGAAVGPIRASASYWPLYYLPSALGILTAIAMLFWAGRSRKIENLPTVAEVAS